jgi:hypothetical protein
MGMRKTAIVALIAMAWAGAPIQQGVSFAQGAPAAMATQTMVSSVSQADKDALMKKEPLTQASYDKRIDNINALIAKLKAGEDFPLSDADAAMAPVKTPY